jgi:hypothetical protein
MTRWGEIKCPRCEMLEEHLCLTEEKLAKAVEALQWCATVHDSSRARTTLAELKGPDDACVSCGAPTPNDFCGFCLEEE